VKLLNILSQMATGWMAHSIALLEPDADVVPYGHCTSELNPSAVPSGQKYPTPHVLRVFCDALVACGQ